GRMEPVDDVSLEAHLKRIEGYMQGCALLTSPRVKSPLRTELAAFLESKLPAAADTWVRQVCGAFGIPESQWDEVREWMHAAALDPPHRGSGRRRDVCLPAQPRASGLHFTLPGIAISRRSDEGA